MMNIKLMKKLYVKDPTEVKYQYLIKKHQEGSFEKHDDQKAFIVYSNNIQDVHKNIEKQNEDRKHKVLIAFDEMITDMISNKSLNQIETELSIRGRKLQISTILIIQSYFALTKNIRLNCTHFFIMKILNKKELQQITINHSSYIHFKVLNLYKKCIAKPMMQLLHQIIFYDLDTIFYKEYRN